MEKCENPPKCEIWGGAGGGEMEFPNSGIPKFLWERQRGTGAFLAAIGSFLNGVWFLFPFIFKNLFVFILFLFILFSFYSYLFIYFNFYRYFSLILFLFTIKIYLKRFHSFYFRYFASFSKLLWNTFDRSLISFK